MKKLNINSKLSLLLILVLLIGGIVLVAKHKTDKAYYRCALAVTPGYARCATIAGPKSCYPAYKLLGTSKEANIDVSANNNAATCEGLAPDQVNYYDKQGHFIETKSYSGEL